MAASLDGVFRIIDRASPAMRSMERQALKTDAAITKLGLSVDGIGSKKQLKQLDQTERGIRNIGVTGDTAMKKVDLGVRKADKSLTKHNRTWSVFKKGVKDTVSELAKFGMIGLKIGGIGSLIGLAAQGIGNLAGGVTALLPRFGQLVSGMGAALPIFGALAQTAIVAKIAFGGLTQAIGGNARALHQLAPAGQQFVKQWRSLRAQRVEIARSIQQPIFSQINRPFRQAFSRARRPLERGFGAVAGAVGGVGAKALQSFSTPKFLQQFTKLSSGSAGIVTRLGGSAINLAHGLTEVALAAQPVVKWLTKSIEVWTKNWAATQKLNGENGKLATRFTNARKALQGLWTTGKDIIGVFKTIMKAATPLGNSLYGAANHSMETWIKFHNTIAGRQGLMQDFMGMENGFRAIFRLVSSIGGALFKMGSQGGLTKTADSLTKMVPALAKGLNSLANNVGPALAQSLGSIVGLFSTLGTGPLPLVLHGITALLQAVTGIVKNSGPFKGVFTTIFSTALISRYLVKLGLLEKGWWNVARAATVAGAAENGASAGGILGPVGRGVKGGVVGFGGRAKGLFGRLRGGSAVAAEGEQLAIPGLEAASGAGRAAGLLGGLGGLAGIAGKLGGVLGVAGKIAWPLAAISGILGGLTAGRNGSVGRQIGQTAFGAVNPLTFGLLGKTGLSSWAMTPAQKAAAYVSGDNKSLSTDLSGADRGRTGLARLTAELAILEQHANKLRGSRQQEYQDYMAQLKQEIAARKALVAQIQSERNQQSRGKANAFLSSLTGAAKGMIAKNGLVGGFHQADVKGLQYLNTGGLNQAGRGQVERGLLGNAFRASKRDPRLKGEYTQLAGAVTGIEAAFGHAIAVGPLGRIFQGTASELQALNSQLKIARSAGNTAGAQFVMQEIAASKAAAAVSAGKKHAGGGRIGGRGLADTVPVPGGMAAPGELVVNRHTEARVNGMLAGHGMTLGGIVGKEARPHSASMYATGGRAKGLKSGIASIGRDVLSHFPGLSVTSTTGGTHAANSYHYRGMAEDIAGPSSLMSRAAGWIQTNLAGRLLEGIHNSGLSIKNGKRVPSSFWGAKTWAGHRDHIHLASQLGVGTPAAGGKTGTAARSSKLNLGFFDPGNLAGFGGISTQGYSAGTMGSKGAGGTKTAPAKALSYNKAGLKSLASFVGFPSNTLNMASAVAMAESHGRSNATHVNSDKYHSVDRGLWQINGHWHPDVKNPFDPVANARAAKSISKNGTNWGPWSTFNNGAYKQYLARGGRTPKFGGWFGKGGSFTTNGPQMIGVGEKGREHVTVTPAHSGSRTSGGGGHVFAPQVHVYGASQDDVERALDKAMHRFADIIDRQPVEGADIAV